MYKKASLKLLCAVLGMQKEASMQKQADPYKPLLDAQRASRWKGTNAGLGLTREDQEYIMNPGPSEEHMSKATKAAENGQRVPAWKPTQKDINRVYDRNRTNSVVLDAGTLDASEMLKEDPRLSVTYDFEPRIDSRRAWNVADSVFRRRYGNPDTGYRWGGPESDWAMDFRSVVPIVVLKKKKELPVTELSK